MCFLNLSNVSYHGIHGIHGIGVFICMDGWYCGTCRSIKRVHEIRWLYGFGLWSSMLEFVKAWGPCFFSVAAGFFCLAVLGGTDETWVFVRVSSLFHLHKTTSVCVGEFSASRLLRRSCGPRLHDQAAGFCWFGSRVGRHKQVQLGGHSFQIRLVFVKGILSKIHRNSCFELG